jgi:hypothetical protein
MQKKNRPQVAVEQSIYHSTDGINQDQYDEKELSHFVRTKEFSLINRIARTIIKPIFQPRAAPGKTGIALG